MRVLRPKRLITAGPSLVCLKPGGDPRAAAGQQSRTDEEGVEPDQSCVEQGCREHEVLCASGGELADDEIVRLDEPGVGGLAGLTFQLTSRSRHPAGSSAVSMCVPSAHTWLVSWNADISPIAPSTSSALRRSGSLRKAMSASIDILTAGVSSSSSYVPRIACDPRTSTSLSWAIWHADRRRWASCWRFTLSVPCRALPATPS